MKKQLNNFIAAIAIIFSLSFCAESCTTMQHFTTQNGTEIVSQKIGETGLKVSAGYNPKKENVWVALIADLKQVKKKTAKWLNKTFPELHIPVTGK